MDGRLRDVLACPRCHGSLGEGDGGGVTCRACGRRFSQRDGYLDLLQVDGESDPAAPTPAMRLMTSRTFVRLYERRMRPFFARVFAGPGVDLPDPGAEFELYRAWHDLGSGKHWLDLSCGTGFFARRVRAAAPGALVAGLDISREMLCQAVEESHAEGGVAWVRGDVYALPFADAVFDGVLNAGSLHLYPDPVAAFEEIARVLKPGGTYSASTFCESGRPLGRAAARLFRIRRTDLGALQAELSSAGFTGYELRPYGDAFVMFVRKRADPRWGAGQTA